MVQHVGFRGSGSPEKPQRAMGVLGHEGNQVGGCLGSMSSHKHAVIGRSSAHIQT